MSGLLFKVLVAGQSCHGGIFTWSLPKDGNPGDWHEVAGDVVQCTNGFHLTDWPPSWWKPNCTIYVVEAEGVVGDAAKDDRRKCAARKVRLLREATSVELASVGIFLSGVHIFRDSYKAIASGSAQVEAYGSAQVEASGSAQVKAYGSAQVEASGSAQVEAYDSAQVEASGSAQVEAYDSAQVKAYGSAQVKAYGSAQVEAYDSAQVEAYDSAQVKAYGSAQVEAYDSAQVKAYGSAQVKAKDRVVITSWRGKEGIRIEGPRVVAVIYPSYYCDEKTMPEVLTAAGHLVVPTAEPKGEARGSTPRKKGRKSKR